MTRESSHRGIFSGRVDRRSTTPRETSIPWRRSSRRDGHCHTAAAQRQPRYTTLSGVYNTPPHGHAVLHRDTDTGRQPDSTAGSYLSPNFALTDTQEYPYTHISSPDSRSTVNVTTGAIDTSQPAAFGNYAISMTEQNGSRQQVPYEYNGTSHQVPVESSEPMGPYDVRDNEPANARSDNPHVHAGTNDVSPREYNPPEHPVHADSITEHPSDYEVAPVGTIGPVPDAVSGYTITELAQPVANPSRHQQLHMMGGADVSGFNNNGPTDCNLSVTSPYPSGTSPQSFSDIIANLPPEFFQRQTRRSRHHRQRPRRRRRSRHRRGRHRHTSGREDEGYVKPRCCSVLGCKICLSVCLKFKKVLVFFASFGVICVLIGIVFGVLRSPGNSFFTLSLMFVGLGLILLTMVLIGWKCTPVDHEPCHMLFGLGMYCSLTRRDRRRRERLYWLGSRMYPEFRYRAPPPSYASAMQEYRNEMRHLESIPESIPYVPGSPPPSYKSHTTIERPGIHIIFPRNEEFPGSNPPTYRLRAQTSRPSLAILNDTNMGVSGQPSPANRFSVSSTTALVESEQGMASHSPGGVVNMSFNESSQALQLHQHEPEVNFHNDAYGRSHTIDGAVQTHSSPNRLPSVTITMEDAASTV